MKKIALFFASLAICGMMVMPALVGAQDTFGVDATKNVGLGSDDDVDIRETAGNIIKIALGFLGIVAIIIVLWGGVMWMTAGGSDRVETAKKILYSGVIGVVIIFSAYALTSYIISTLQDEIVGS